MILASKISSLPGISFLLARISEAIIPIMKTFESAECTELDVLGYFLVLFEIQFERKHEQTRFEMNETRYDKYMKREFIYERKSMAIYKPPDEYTY